MHPDDRFDINKKLFSVYVMPENYLAAEQWCYNNVGPLKYVMPFPRDMLFETIEPLYRFFWGVGGNTFYFNNMQTFLTFQSLFGVGASQNIFDI